MFGKRIESALALFKTSRNLGTQESTSLTRPTVSRRLKLFEFSDILSHFESRNYDIQLNVQFLLSYAFVFFFFSFLLFKKGGITRNCRENPIFVRRTFDCGALWNHWQLVSIRKTPRHHNPLRKLFTQKCFFIFFQA